MRQEKLHPCDRLQMKSNIAVSEGMAKEQKSFSSPAAFEAPKALVPLMQAFHVGLDKIAKSLILESIGAIYSKDGFGKDRAVSESALDDVISLMKCIAPRDSLETLFAAQIVIGHLLGMRKLEESCFHDQKLGLNLLRFSNEAMQQLEKKRRGAIQNITINYGCSTPAKASIQTVLPKRGN